MSRIDDLIAELCPNGVAFEPLGRIGEWYGGGTPSKDRLDFWHGGTIPWVSPKDMGRPTVETTEDYITEAAIKGSATRLVLPDSVAMVVRSSILDRTFPTALISIPVTLNQDMKAVVPRSGILPGFVSHILRSCGQDILRVARKTGGSVASIESSKLFAYRIPVPPIEVQREIVRVLDTFSALEAELEETLNAELAARRRQYTYYRDALLTFAEDTGSTTSHEPRATSHEPRATSHEPRATSHEPRESVRLVALGDVAEFVYGYTTSAKDTGDYRFIRITDINPCGKLSATDAKYVDASKESSEYLVSNGDLLMARTGATFGKTMLVQSDELAVFASFLIRIRVNPDVLLPAYYWHFAQSSSYWSQAIAMASKGGQPQFNGNVLKLVKIPVPSIKTQARIVSILDRFDALVNDISVGLPAELAARRSQYEYYRDRLLTFDELSA